MANKTISDGGITVDLGLSKSILLIDHPIAGAYMQKAGDSSRYISAIFFGFSAKF